MNFKTDTILQNRYYWHNHVLGIGIVHVLSRIYDKVGSYACRKCSDGITKPNHFRFVGESLVVSEENPSDSVVTWTWRVSISGPNSEWRDNVISPTADRQHSIDSIKSITQVISKATTNKILYNIHTARVKLPAPIDALSENTTWIALVQIMA